MMSSDRRIESSRANGALSLGPITPEGKRRSSRNAETHGIYSAAILIGGESPAAFDEVRANYYLHYQPDGKLEGYLVDELIACRWRQHRMASMEAATVSHQVDTDAPAIADSFETIDHSTRAALAWDHLSTKSRAIESFRRHESALSRQYHRVTRHLDELQEKRKSKISQNEPNPKNEQ